ncbi:MAG: ComF family protein [Pseudomonadota bacterium]
MLQRLLTSAIKPDFAWPMLVSQCAVCRSWPARQVCSPCISRFADPLPRCLACALPLLADLSMGLRTPSGLCADCIKQHPPPDATLVAVPYAYPWSELITRYKFGERPGWAAFFAELLLQAPGVQQAFRALQTADLILPMPLSGQRLQSRGFNQAWELASTLARQSRSAAKTDARLLLRVKHTRPQTELRREARLANVKGAFQVDPLRVPALAGRRVILVDDVITSGASLFTAAQVLRSAGAVHVTGLAIARTAAT